MRGCAVWAIVRSIRLSSSDGIRPSCAELRSEKLKAITLLWMMAPSPSGSAVLGRHHPALNPRTMTGITRTTTEMLCPAAKAAVSSRSSEMATRDISIAKENNRMRQEGSMSQINRYVVLNKSNLSGKKLATTVLNDFWPCTQGKLPRGTWPPRARSWDGDFSRLQK